jgi:hypothetical protein
MNKLLTHFRLIYLFSFATSSPNNQYFLANNHVEKALPTPTTTTQQTPNCNANQKHNLKLNGQKASGAFLFNNNNQRKEKT